MENIIKTVLEKQLDSLRKEAKETRSNINSSFNEEAKEQLVLIDSMFENWDVDINDKDIRIFHKDIHSFSGPIRIQFQEKYIDKKYVEMPPYITWNSADTDEEINIDLGILIGLLCKAQRLESEQWNNFIRIYDNKKMQIKETIEVILKNLYEIEDELKKIDRKEEEEKINKILKTGKLDFDQEQWVRYGEGKWDRCRANSIEWKENASGKTYEFWFILKQTKNLIAPRFKKDNLVYLVKQLGS